MTRASLAFGFLATAMLPIITWLSSNGTIPSIPYLSLLVWLPSVVIAITVQFGRLISGFLLPILVVLIWTVMSLGWVDSTERGRGMLIAAGLLTAYVVSVLLWREQAWTQNAELFVYGTAFVALIMGLYWVDTGLSGFGTLRNDTGTIVTNRNAVASQLGFAALLALTVIRLRFGTSFTKPRHSAMVAATILLIVSVVLTGSRGGTASVIVGIMVITLGNRDWRKISLADCFYAFGALLGIGAVVLIPNPLTARLVGVDLSQVGDRVPIWEGALRTLEQASFPRWIVGFGTGGSDKAVASNLADFEVVRTGVDGVNRISLHNTYIEWFVSYGFIGVILAVIAGGWIVFITFRGDSATRSVTGLTMLIFFCLYSISGIVYKLPYAGASMALFFGYLGVSMIAHREQETQAIPEDPLYAPTQVVENAPMS